MAAKEMRIEPARIQRCDLVPENPVLGICIASPLKESLAYQAQARPRQAKGLWAVPLQYLHHSSRMLCPEVGSANMSLTLPKRVAPRSAGFSLPTSQRAPLFHQ